MRFEKCAYNVDVEVPKPSLPAEPRRAYVVALIPAHREEAEIGNTIRSLLAQNRPPNKIVVITNRTEDTNSYQDFLRAYPKSPHGADVKRVVLEP